MSKRGLLLAGLLLTVYFVCAITVFGGQTSVSNPGKADIDVKGGSVNTKDYYEIILGKTGEDSVRLPDGTTISGKSDSDADKGLHVLIVPITEKDEQAAYKWMTSVTSKLGKDPLAYYYGFFESDNSPATPAGNVSLDVTAQSGYENAKLYCLSPDENIRRINYTSYNGQMNYEIKSLGYYIVLNSSSSGGGSGGGSTPAKPADPDNPDNPDNPGNPDNPDNPGNPDDPDNPNNPSKPDNQNPDNTNHGGTNGGNGQTPKTGDSSRLLLWGALMLGSFGFLMVTVCRKRIFSKKM